MAAVPSGAGRTEGEAVPSGVIWEMADIAQRVGWTTRRVRRVLVSAGAATKVGGRWVTTRGRLRAHMPEVLEALEATEETPEGHLHVTE